MAYANYYIILYDHDMFCNFITPRSLGRLGVPQKGHSGHEFLIFKQSSRPLIEQYIHVFIFSLERLYQDNRIHDLTSWQEFVC